MKRVVLVHYHLFKNAGTSFNWALRSAFGDGFREHDTDHPDGRIEPPELLAFLEENPALRAVSSHQICFPAPESERLRSAATVFVRHPLARIRSVYSFQRKQDPSVSRAAAMANRLDFREFVDWSLETVPATILDFQVRFCARPEARASARAPGPADLEIAKRHLAAAALVGVVERYDESLSVANRRLAPSFPGIALRASRLNTTSAGPKSREAALDELREELGHEVTSRLELGNRLDEALYAFANAWLDRELAAGSGVATGAGTSIASPA